MECDLVQNKFLILLAQTEEAHRYKRDTTRRIEELTRFYGVGLTVLCGVMTLPYVANFDGPKAVFVLFGSLFLYLLGLATFMRAVNIKTQTAQHTAWQKSAEYSVVKMAFPENTASEKPVINCDHGGPFEQHTAPVLMLFSIFNSFILMVSTVSLVYLITTEILQLSGTPTWWHKLIYVVPTSIVFFVSLGLCLYHFLTSRRDARRESKKVLERSLMIEPDLILRQTELEFLSARTNTPPRR